MEVEGLAVDLCLLRAVDGVHHDALAVGSMEHHIALCVVARDGDGLFASERNFGHSGGIASPDWTDGEAEAIVATAHLVALERTTLTAAGTAETRHFGVEVEGRCRRSSRAGRDGVPQRAAAGSTEGRSRHDAVGNEGCTVA